jgi:hypothetical protein
MVRAANDAQGGGYCEVTTPPGASRHPRASFARLDPTSGRDKSAATPRVSNHEATTSLWPAKPVSGRENVVLEPVQVGPNGGRGVR